MPLLLLYHFVGLRINMSG